MLTYAIIAGGVLATLVLLKVWAATKSSAPVARPSGGIVYETQASKLDVWVSQASDWWPHLRGIPLFPVGVIATAIMLMLAAHYGYVRGQPLGTVGIVMFAAFFGIADLAIPIIALHDATDDGKRSVLGTSLITIATAMSFWAMIGSTSEISTTNSARMDVGLINQRDTMKLLETKQKERDSIPIDRGAQALNDLAAATEEAAGREGGRTRCAQKCEELKKQAADYRARAKEAERKERLTAEIEQLKSRLTGAGANEQRTDADPAATLLSGLTNGFLSRDGLRAYSMTMAGLGFVTTITLLWLYIGGKLNEAIQKERAHRGAIADEQRAVMGLPPKYTAQAAAPAPTTPLLTDDRISAKDDPGIVLNVQIDNIRKRFANDAALLETNALFGAVLETAEGGTVTIADLYKAYRVAVLTNNPDARYMTQPTMAQKLYAISQHRDDVRVSADGILSGWILRPVDQRKLESAHA